MKNKLIGLLAMLGISVPISFAGGMYLGSIVMTAWLNLKSEPSVSMLYHYWKYYDRLRPGVQTAFEVSVFIALLIPIVVAVIICAAMLMKPKRELHGSARFANRMEITKHGLLLVMRNRIY